MAIKAAAAGRLCIARRLSLHIAVHFLHRESSIISATIMRLQSTAIFVAFAAQLALISSRSVVLPGQVTPLPDLHNAPRCEPLILNSDKDLNRLVHYCATGAQGGSRHSAYFPNFRGQNQEDAIKEIVDYIPLLESDCSDRLGTLLCFYYFPYCNNQSSNASPGPNPPPTPIGPCANTCELSKAGCEPIYKKLFWSWPDHLDCTNSHFPQPGAGLCADGVMAPFKRHKIREEDLSGSGSGGNETSEHDNICEEPQSIANGEVVWTGLSVSSEAMYFCDTDRGYELSGDNPRICQEDGSWSGEAPTCEIVDCGPPSSLNNGETTYQMTTVGSMATYSCHEGYQFLGASQRTCQHNGTWSGEVPTCQICVCPSTCKVRKNCGSNTFTRNFYTFAARVTVLRRFIDEFGNTSYEVRLVHQYLPRGEGSPQLPGTIIHTTDPECCGVCNHIFESIHVQRDYLFAGYYDAETWYLDTQDSLFDEWKSKFDRNMEKWVAKRQ